MWLNDYGGGGNEDALMIVLESKKRGFSSRSLDRPSAEASEGGTCKNK